jgi:glycosyltransferase involved in cell wall biosynthesis
MSSFSLSAVIITFNEEQNIARCLDSVQGIADEVIVVDSFSTDQTESMCLTRGVRFFQLPWAGYAASKNYGNRQASCDYILSIDADEALSEELRECLRDEKEKSQADAYSLNRLTNYCGQWIRHGGWYPDSKIRLFKRGHAQWTGEVHEALNFISPPRLGHLTGDLLHYSYPTVESHLTRSMKYAWLVAQRDYRRGRKKNLLVHGVLKPSFFFFNQYFLKLGFCDGYYGFVIAVISALEKFMRFVGHRELSKPSH